MTEHHGDNLVGKQLGDYQLIALMAEGGMAKIYRAMDIELEREVAVKVLTMAMVDADTTLAERFQREARAVARLEHEHIIPIYRAGSTRGYYYLAMKLITGKDLADELIELKQQYKLMNPRRMLHIMEQMASALDFAHKAGIVHRDVKPSNILIDETGKAVLSDFGLVLQMEVDKTMGTAFGTPRYISPEQALASEKAVPASDIYSLAVIVYEILTGHMLFEAENAMQIALSHISELPKSPVEVNPDVPETVAREVLKALEKDPVKRHATAGEFVTFLKAAYGDTLPSPREIAPELAQSHTPVLDAPPNFERIAAEQRRSIISAPHPLTETKGDELQTIDQAIRPTLKPGMELETTQQRKRDNWRYRVFLLVMIAVIIEMIAVATDVGEEFGLHTPPTWVASLLGIGEDTATPTTVPVVVDDTATPEPTATETEQPTVVETTPEETPEETPEPTGVEVTPEETPEETPGVEVTPEETPEETPEPTGVAVTPEETPEETPESTEVEITPEKTPEETPEPTGVEVTPEETPEPTGVVPPPEETPEPTGVETTPTATPEETVAVAADTEIPPTETDTPTDTEEVPTETNTPTATDVPDTDTPTATDIPPTDTHTPTETGIPPTATRTPTRTAVPPTRTRTPTPTATIPTETGTPTPDFTPGEGELITLLYDRDVLVLRNDSESELTLSLSGLVLISEDGETRFRIGDDFQDTQPGDCIIIFSENEASVDLPEEWHCENHSNQSQLPEESFFWRQAGGSFQVMYDEVILPVMVEEETIEQCPAVHPRSRVILTCTFNWPGQ